MKNKISARFLNCILFLSIGILAIFSPFVGKAQNSSAVNLAGTIWDNDKNPIRKFNSSDNSVTEFIFYIYFHQQGKVEVKYIIDKSAGTIEKYEWENVTNYDGTTEYKQVKKRTYTSPSVTGRELKGTYQIKGKIIYIDVPDFTIEVTFSATSMEGVITPKDTKKDEAVRFTKTANQNNSSSEANSSSKSTDKLQLTETLFARAEDLSKQADDLRSKGKALESQEKFREAIDIYTSIIQIELNTNGHVIRAYNRRAGVKIALKDYKGAIEDCSNAIRLSAPLKKNVMEFNAEVRKAMSGSEDPFSIIPSSERERLRELREKNPEVSAAIDGLQYGYLFRAMAKNKLGDKTGACEDFRMLCALGFGYNCKEPNEFCN